MRRGAFTLIEVMAVVTLLGMLAGATAWSLAEDARHSSRTNVIGQITLADHMARLAAQRLGRPCALRFDLRQLRVWRVADGEEHRASHTLKLPTGYRIGRIVVSSTYLSPETASSKTDSGVVDIAYSTGGRSVSYAVRLDGDGEQWLLFSGLTGQVTLIDDEDEIDNLFTMLAAGRPDAH